MRPYILENMKKKVIPHTKEGPSRKEFQKSRLIQIQEGLPGKKRIRVKREFLPQRNAGVKQGKKKEFRKKSGGKKRGKFPVFHSRQRFNHRVKREKGSGPEGNVGRDDAEPVRQWKRGLQRGSPGRAIPRTKGIGKKR